MQAKSGLSKKIITGSMQELASSLSPQPVEAFEWVFIRLVVEGGLDEDVTGVRKVLHEV
ncbi:hypothetical protein FA13DRAFT_1737701, partial [Coprinellus micaceus]